MVISDLFITALMPVLKNLLITAVGSVLALAPVDLLGPDARKHLNNLVFYVLGPVLVGSNLAAYTTSRSIALLWFMPLNVLFTFIIGSALGWLLNKITKVPHDLQGIVLGSCAAGNLGSMPLIIVPAVCKERGSPFGDASSCNMHGLAYVSLSMAIGSIYMWSYVYNIIRIYSSKEPAGEAGLSVIAEGANSAGETTENSSACHTGPPLPLKECCLYVESTVSEVKEKVLCLEKIKHGLQMVGRKVNGRKLFTPSIIGAIIGLIVGTVPPFRKMLVGDDAPVHVIQDSALLLGEAAIPTVTLIVGANLLKGLKEREVQVGLIIGIIVARYIVLPVLGVVIVKAALHFGLVKSDPLYEFVLLLQYALPPAISIGTMTQLFRAGEGAFSVILLWTYVLATVALTLWCAFFMWLVG